MFYMFYRNPVVNANNVGPDQTLQSVASDLDRVYTICLAIKILRLKWVI